MNRKPGRHSTIPVEGPPRQRRQPPPPPRANIARPEIPRPTSRKMVGRILDEGDASLLDVLDILNKGVVERGHRARARGRRPRLRPSCRAAVRGRPRPPSKLEEINLDVHGFVADLKTAAGELTVGGHRIELLAIAGLRSAVERLDERPATSERALRRQHAIVTRLARDGSMPFCPHDSDQLVTLQPSRATCRPANRRIAEKASSKV